MPILKNAAASQSIKSAGLAFALAKARSAAHCGLTPDIVSGPGCVNNSLMHRGQRHPYSITSSARACRRVFVLSSRLSISFELAPWSISLVNLTDDLNANLPVGINLPSNRPNRCGDLLDDHRSEAEDDQGSLACDDMSGGAQHLGRRQGADDACRRSGCRAADGTDHCRHWPPSRHTKQGRSA